jgi:hypothetical protein
MAKASSLKRGVSSQRGLLASLWSLVTVMTVLAFIVALIFTFAGVQEGDSYSNRNQNTNDQDASDPKVAVTSRGMAVAALWTAVLATLISIFGTVILGWQSPTGRYYSCCSTKVHQTNALSLGSFIGTVFMFANLTFICAILFGEFEVIFIRVKSTF